MPLIPSMPRYSFKANSQDLKIFHSKSFKHIQSSAKIAQSILHWGLPEEGLYGCGTVKVNNLDILERWGLDNVAHKVYGRRSHRAPRGCSPSAQREKDFCHRLHANYAGPL